jgi:hypothetical protein
MKHISTKNVFFNIFHHPPLEFNLFGFIGDPKIRAFQRVSCPLGGSIKAFSGGSSSYFAPKKGIRKK